MPKYQVQLKQGRDVKTVNVEAPSVASVLAFYEYVCTMKVTEIRRIEYVAPTDTIPVDDFNYYPVVKTIARNDSLNVARPFLFNNIKLTIDENELFAKMKECFEVDGLKIDTIMATVFKGQMNT